MAGSFVFSRVVRPAPGSYRAKACPDLIGGGRRVADQGRRKLKRRQTIRRGLAGATVLRHLVGNLLAFAQRLQAGALDCADVDEYVLATVIRLDEAIAFLRVEPLDRSSAHSGCPLIDERLEIPGAAAGAVGRCLERARLSGAGKDPVVVTSVRPKLRCGEIYPQGATFSTCLQPVPRTGISHTLRLASYRRRLRRRPRYPSRKSCRN